MKTVCEIDKCAGCMACIDVCPKGAISIKDNIKSYNTVIDEKLCINCNVCHAVCQANHPTESVLPIKWYQGWAATEHIRSIGSSGGLATALSKRFIEDGGVVWSCVFENGIFGFQQADAVEQLERFAGSKYVKSNPSGAYKAIRHDLTDGKKILFIGLPCQVSSLKNFVGTKMQPKLYTVDLICHGSPSPRVLEIFLQQYGYSLSELEDIKFRKKTLYQLYCSSATTKDYRSIAATGTTDRYLISFLNCISYTDNCYSCSYAKTERISDITLGDSWGSNLSDIDQKKGISLILCQTLKGVELIERSELQLENVNIKTAIERNYQLRAPSAKPKNRDFFIEGLQNGKNFNKLVKKIYPIQCYKQMLKKWLMRLHLMWGKMNSICY